MQTAADVGVEELSADECRQLLAAQHFGRLAVVVGGQPVILPVSYIFDRDRIVFRTAAGLKLRHAPLRRVAFEIDDVDEAAGTGWSVLVKGSAFDITRATDQLSEELRRLQLRPMASGEKPHWLEIVPTEITGRRVAPLTGAGS